MCTGLASLQYKGGDTAPAQKDLGGRGRGGTLPCACARSLPVVLIPSRDHPGWISASQGPSVFWAEVGSGTHLSPGLGHPGPREAASLGVPRPQSPFSGPPPLPSLSFPLANIQQECALCRAEGPAMRTVLPRRGACPCRSLCKSAPLVLRAQRALNGDLVSPGKVA